MRTFILFVVLVVFVGSCGAVKSTANSVAKSVVDCTTATAKQHIDQYAPLLDMTISRAIDAAGRIDKDMLKAATKGFVAATGGCVLATTIGRLLNPGVDPGAPQTSPLPVDHDALLADFNEIRSAQLGGATYKTSSGTL